MNDPGIHLPFSVDLEGISTREASEIALQATELLVSRPPGGDPEIVVYALAAPVNAILARWRASQETAGALAKGPLTDRQAEYDEYFYIRRVITADPLRLHHEAALVAYYRIMLDCLQGCSLQPVEMGHLRATLEGVFYWRAGGADARHAKAGEAALRGKLPAPGAGVDALGRWRHGHYAFFVLVQALIIAHARLSTALSERRISVAHEALSIATQLWWGTAAAFRFTSDFPTKDYIDIVRPSMGPPHVQEGFSGLSFADHAHLIRVVKSLQPSLQSLPSELHRQHRQYLWALDAAYESHAFACERFVGNGQSLNGTHKNRLSSATSMIRDQLKVRTMEGAGGPPDTQG